ncbi:hypothetical protein [Streptomyces sp. NPDC058678]|uniref:hypothetical protein n=1 Tax=Streptomyces sp. NPDC058678 TaxID=3346595 RepID=UPI0036646278
MDRCALPRQPDQRDEWERAAGFGVQEVLATGVRLGFLPGRREQVVVPEVRRQYGRRLVPGLLGRGGAQGCQGRPDLVDQVVEAGGAGRADVVRGGCGTFAHDCARFPGQGERWGVRVRLPGPDVAEEFGPARAPAAVDDRRDRPVLGHGSAHHSSRNVLSAGDASGGAAAAVVDGARPGRASGAGFRAGLPGRARACPADRAGFNRRPVAPQ